MEKVIKNGVLITSGVSSFKERTGVSVDNVLKKYINKAPKEEFTYVGFDYEEYKNGSYFITLTAESKDSPLMIYTLEGVTFPIEFKDFEPFSEFFYMLNHKYTHLNFDFISYGNATIILNGLRDKSLDENLLELINSLKRGVSVIEKSSSSNEMIYGDAVDDFEVLDMMGDVLKKYGGFINGWHVVFYADISYNAYVELGLITLDKFLKRSFRLRGKGKELFLDRVEKLLERGGLIG